MFRKCFFMLFAVICFMSTIITEKAISATPITKDAPQIRHYTENNHNFKYSINVIRYSKQNFNIELYVWNKKDYNQNCEFKSKCTQDDINFICQGNAAEESSNEQTISGVITPYVIDVLKSDDNEICKNNAPLMGLYQRNLERQITGPNTSTINVIPIKYDTIDDSDVYLLKDKSGHDFYVDTINNAEILQKFNNSWIDLEYFGSIYYLGGKHIINNVIYKINGKNPMEIK